MVTPFTSFRAEAARKPRTVAALHMSRTAIHRCLFAGIMPGTRTSSSRSRRPYPGILEAVVATDLPVGGPPHGVRRGRARCTHRRGSSVRCSVFVRWEGRIGAAQKVIGGV